MEAVFSDTTIQALASEAKKRMKRGYWNEIKEKRRNDGPESAFRRDTDKNRLTKEEESYYLKVKKILTDEREGIVVNPIGRLMDRQHYSGLTPSEKQHYVFKLSEIYVSIKNKLGDSF